MSCAKDVHTQTKQRYKETTGYPNGLCILHLLTKRFGNYYSEGCTLVPDRSRPECCSCSRRLSPSRTPVDFDPGCPFLLLLKRNRLISAILSPPAQPGAEE